MSIFLYVTGFIVFTWGLLDLAFSSFLIALTTQAGQADYPAAMYFVVAAIGFMYAGRSLMLASIDKK